jgi:uncharacterized protein (UPF0276 family)
VAAVTEARSTSARRAEPKGAGLGLRRALIEPLLAAPVDAIDFLECAPDNWIGVGGRLGEALRELGQRHPLSCHGLSLSLGGSAPLDVTFLQRTRAFLDQHQVQLYSEHLSWCSDEGQLYELLPLPFTEETVRHLAARIRQTQDILGRRIAVENSSYYLVPAAEMDEAGFINAVLAEADCDLLLDINNVFVNASNHGYDPLAFIKALPGERIASYHIAGHHDDTAGMKIDTHGMPVKDDVWQLLQTAYTQHGVRPTLLERDFNFPPLPELLDDVQRIRHLQAAQ